VLFADQEEAIAQIDESMSTSAGLNPYNLWKTQSQALASLCRFERSGAAAVAL
jgi:hypothetical protein